ncbi:MAG TPA: type II toxin-antitoxin system HicB family antitoxin [Bacteroidota bacterium]|nr:type II toxin-antitoxin system HicB family antitoxin [Candidatus Kapabacteria bacterium]HRS00970.1 type II toxin-antitoxin system HicB family antitoxin [Bacteroidota bacterium]
MISFKIERDGDEYHAWVPELKGCHTHGRTISEAMQNLKDAVQLYLEEKMEEEIAKQTLEMIDEA